MIRVALNIKWQYHTSNYELYGNIPKITIKIREHKMRFSGYCWINREEIISEVFLLEPLHRQRKPDSRRRHIQHNLETTADSLQTN